MDALNRHAMHAPQESTWIAKNFKFHTGEIFKELPLGFITLGDPSGIPVLILHGTTGSARAILAQAFGGALFGPGQPLDSNHYFVVIPDALGSNQSSKPSDGLRMQYPQYNYQDMVHAQYQLVKNGLGIDHLRLVLGNSMGGMHAWLWGIYYPDFMDALVPMAATPAAMSGRNWMMRRLIIDSIQHDPLWMDGNYHQQPPSVQFASTFYSIATNGGVQNIQSLAPTANAADAYLDKLLHTPVSADANDLLYLWQASRDYDPAPFLEKIQARVLAITSQDDERNPPELGLLQSHLSQIPHAQWHLIPASTHTCGHNTTGHAIWWADALDTFLKSNFPR